MNNDKLNDQTRATGGQAAVNPVPGKTQEKVDIKKLSRSSAVKPYRKSTREGSDPLMRGRFFYYDAWEEDDE